MKMYSSLTQAKASLENLEAIDYFFARQVLEYFDAEAKLKNGTDRRGVTDTIESILKPENNQLFHTLMCLQKYYRDGHTCLPLADIAGKTFWDTKDDEQSQDTPKKSGHTFADFETLKAEITKLQLGLKAPISYHYDCLYMNRLWLFENEIADNLVKRVSFNYSNENTQIKTILDKLFTKTDNQIDWQKVAVAKSINTNFSIISGGPGTGKTTTVAKLILTLQQLADKDLDIQMIAPTGKAAQCLKESIASFKVENQSIDTKALPNEAQTLHRFLGLRPNSDRTKYNKDRKSNADVLIVDEASMIDINSFIYIIRAIKDDCKLILLGDINQLPSVETGNILAELAKVCDGNNYTQNTVAYLKEICDLKDNSPLERGADRRGVADNAKNQYDFITFLQKSYRTDSQDILKMASDVINGDVKDYPTNTHIDYQILDIKNYDKQVNEFIKEVCLPEFKKVQNAKSPQQALDILKQFRILVANKNITVGTQIINDKISRYLKQTPAFHYHAKPIMIVVNDYNSKLFNGDVGIIWNDKAYFEGADNTLRELGIARLPKHETVYAMTIHKTQGSEFNHVAIILPEEHNRLLTRELLYTGITRAKSKVYIRTSKGVWADTVRKKVHRHSNINKIMTENKTDRAGEL
jgi:exodeoxyribonuclease V alpha subunit